MKKGHLCFLATEWYGERLGASGSPLPKYALRWHQERDVRVAGSATQGGGRTSGGSWQPWAPPLPGSRADANY
jgi:hypothetical protein